MSFDNLTLTGLLLTLPYIAMLALYRKNTSDRRQVEPLELDCDTHEPCRYGT